MKLLEVAINEQSIEGIRYLLALKAGVNLYGKLKDVNNKTEMMVYIRNHSHLSNFGLLGALVEAEGFELSKFKLKFEELAKERDRFYKAIKPSEFTIKDHETPYNKREVSYPNKTTFITI